MLPLPADTYSVSDTADLLFGSVPTPPPSITDGNDQEQLLAEDNAPSSPGRADTSAADASPEGRDEPPMEFRREMTPPMFTGPGIPDSRYYPPQASTYPGYQQPAPAYYPGYQGYPSQPESHLTGIPSPDGYAASYPMSDSYAMPSTTDHGPDAVRYAPDDTTQGYSAGFGTEDLSGGTPQGAADMFRPAD